jgi:hypothetical protein
MLAHILPPCHEISEFEYKLNPYMEITQMQKILGYLDLF